MAEESGARTDRIERLVEALADKQNKLDDVVTLLVEAQIKVNESTSR